MQCCVPFCENTSDTVSPSDGKGITFHEFPREACLRAAWLRALGMQDSHHPDPAVVCSLHFLDDDFHDTEDCVRQIRSDAIPSAVQLCVICLDTDSKLVPMSRHKLEETYPLLTGLPSFNTDTLRQTVCVLCAQRLTNFSRLRDLSLRAHSLLMDLLQKHQLITIQHIKMFSHTINRLKSDLVSTTRESDHCDLYIYHSDENQKPELEDINVATVINEVSWDPIDVKVKIENYNQIDDLNDENFPSSEDYLDSYSEMKTQNVKCENAVLKCKHCMEEFVEENAYYEHLSLHMQNTGNSGFESSQVCEPRVSVSWESMDLRNEEGTQRMNADPLAIPDSPHTSPPLSKVQAAEGSAAILKSKQTHEVQISDICINKPTNNIDNIHDNNKDSRSESHTGEKLHTCERCGFKCARKSSLYRHMRIHTGEKPHCCDMCNYKTARKCQLAKHKRTHTDDKPYSCNICNFSCARNNSFVLHMRSHIGDKPFSCEVCDYKSEHKGNLVRHMKIHTGEKPYACEECDYRSTHKSSLIAHNMTTHTGEKPYSCDVCNFSCAHKTSYTEHMRSHTGEKPYSCTVCNYRSAYKSNLTSHMKIHTGEKLYSCYLCDYKGIRSSDLAKHMRRHTAETSAVFV
ncbi:zinc finger protein 260 isoform X2 [Bicyclus anynana]|uniref:Zinc finger protein 260 isoform X2 n=1 Tax=Bicyclus anynana TaxID=110368 RepID=A0ABM3M4F1_BICAN|nr:zinc finger protein 260 isoform X2 [Bicyclus anynana]